MSTVLYGSATWDPDSITDGNETTKDVTVTGATVGDLVQVSHSSDIIDGTLTGSVIADDTVTVSLSSRVGTINVATGTVYVRVTTLSGLHVT